MAQLPSFLVIGAAKCGTTSLHEYLRQHPAISLPRCKETHYFIYGRTFGAFPRTYAGRTIDDAIDTLEGYLHEFEGKPRASVFGEVCPSYYFYPTAAENIRRTLPEVKLICLLRNPVDRLHSELRYNLDRTAGDPRSRVSFDDQVAALLAASADALTQRALDIGFYARNLSRYFERFPRENMKFFLLRDLESEPQRVMDEITDFIGVPRYKFRTEMKFNVSGGAASSGVYRWLRAKKINRTLRDHLPGAFYQRLRSFTDNLFFKPSGGMSPETRKLLQGVYRDDILQLQSMIGRDLSGWLE